jgi:hypothetical protein
VLACLLALAIVPIPGTGSSEHAEENIAVSPGGPPKAESPDAGPRPAAPQAPPRSKYGTIRQCNDLFD